MKYFLPVLLVLLLPAAAIALDISGDWTTGYGTVTLTQSGNNITGTYYAGDGKITGSLQGSKLPFTYRDSSDAGSGIFTFASDGESFTGTWQASGGSGEWNGWRPGLNSSVTGSAPNFTGTYTTTYGAMRLTQTGNKVTGTYSFSDQSSLTGTVSGNTLTLTYTEPTATGEGEFVLAPDGNSFAGKWRAQGSTEWQEWTGTRTGTGSEAGAKWLVIFESPWEESLAEPQYSFGDMLTAYFRRVPDVRVRVRVINDRADFQRAARELPYLDGPVYLLLSGHGDNTGYLAGSDQISAAEVSAAINPLANLKLLNFSACSVMAGSVPQQVLDALPAGRHLTISGYTKAADWGSSACLEFLYYDLILAQDQAPAAAARTILKELNFSGTRQTSGSPLDPLGFTFIEK